MTFLAYSGDSDQKSRFVLQRSLLDVELKHLNGTQLAIFSVSAIKIDLINAASSYISDSHMPMSNYLLNSSCENIFSNSMKMQNDHEVRKRRNVFRVPLTVWQKLWTNQIKSVL